MRHCRKSVVLSLLVFVLAAIAVSRSKAGDPGLQFPARIDVDRYPSVALPGDTLTGKNAVSVDGPVREAMDAARSASAKPASDNGPGSSATSDTAASPAGEPLRLPLLVARRDPVKPADVPPPAAKKHREPAQPDAAAAAETPAKPPLSAEMAALRDRVRAALATYFQQSLNTRDNNASDMLQVCLAYGCQTEVVYGSDKLNGITCICWNYPCAEYQPLMLVDGHIAARVGYGVQTEPAQLLAVLALSRVPIAYPTRVGSKIGSVADLVEFEKRNCRAGIDQPFRLIGLAYYAAAKDSWKNDRGEPWNLERMVREELDRPDAESSVAGVNRLLGLGYAVARLSKTKGTLGDLGRAKKYLDDYRQFALGLQNSDGSWHPLFFAAVGASRNWEGTLVATAHIFEWLAISSSAEQLESSDIIRPLDYLTTLLTNQSSRWNAAALSAKDLDGVMHALHGLSVYDERVFKPHDTEKPKADTEKPAAAKEDAAK